MIDPNIITTVRVGELPPADFNLTDNLPHEIGEELKRGTVQQLADVIRAYLGTSDSLAFNPTTVSDGGTLPATDSNEWMLVGKGSFNNVGGGSNITTTEELNAVTSNGTYWSLAVQIPINVELAGIVQTIRSGYLTTAPSENAIYNRFSEIISMIPGTQTTDDVINNSDVDGTTVTNALDFLKNNFENKKDFIKYADDYANLTDAINATPIGGTLILGNTSYTGNISIVRSGINIVGSKMPGFHATLDQLSGGTIINGTFVIDGNNISISNLGVDCGTAQCIALNSGNPMEGLVMHDSAATELNFNNSAENVIAIVKANTTMHALLFEGLANSVFRNVHGKGGDFGVVFKISDSNASEIYGYESRTTNVYIKSDSYAPCLRSNFNNINSVSNVITASQPVAVHASTSNLFDINVNNVNIYGGTRQFRLIASPASAPNYVMSNVNVSNVAMENGVDVGLDCYGVVYNTAFNNILVRNTVSGQGVFSDSSGRGINFNNIRFDDNSGNNLDTAIDIRSYSVLNNIVSIRNTDQTNLGGINLNNFANSSKIGIYVGNLKINGVSVNRDKLTGQGTSNFLPKYDTAGILKNSLFFENGLDAALNTNAPYSLGAGWSLFNVANTTGAGFVTKVGVTPALRITSSSANSGLNELRNIPINIGTNAITRLIVGASGELTIVTSPTTSAGTYDFLTRNASTGVIEKLPSTSLATSGTYTPTITGIANFTSSTFISATYTVVGNSVTVLVDITVKPAATNTLTEFSISLPVTVTLFGGTQSSIGAGTFANTDYLPIRVSKTNSTTAKASFKTLTDINSGSVSLIFTYQK